MAVERLHELAASNEYDLIVIDTPPSRACARSCSKHPDRLIGFLSHPIYSALTVPSRSFARVTNAATTAFLWTVKRLAGPSIVEDTIEFFRSIAGMEAGLRERAAEVRTLLHAEQTAFVLVSSPRAEAIDEATFLAAALERGGFQLSALVVNMIHPLPPELSTAIDSASIDGPLAEQLAYHRELRQLALSERQEVDALVAAAGDVTVTRVPLLDHDVHDVTALTEVAVLLGALPASA